MKALIVDLNRCNGCYNCQLACKDEHCDNDWAPIAIAQPQTGQFWCRVEEEERGRVPVVRVAYAPVFCGHCDACPLIELAPEAVYRREDGLVVIDPEKAQGRRDLVEACPLGMVYFNDDAQVAQKCTGCAHLLDGGWSQPRCVDACATDALRWGDIENFSDEIATGDADERLKDLGSHVFYLNRPKRWIAGTVANRSENEVVVGAPVTVLDADGEVVAQVETDEFGDFRYCECEKASYRVRIEAPGYDAIELDADCADRDVVLDDVFVDMRH